MARKASRFKVGLFVIIGLGLGLAVMVYLGASRYAEGSDTYVTYFGESVQGLSRDSVVKYLGVDVGRVTQIRVAPDSKLIEVVMAINFKGELGKNMVAQLKMAGITGLSFVELDRREPGEPDLSPQLSFAAEYPIIPSKPSELQHILSVVEKITKELDQVNFKDMSVDIQGILSSANRVMSGRELKNTLKNLEDATSRLAAMSKRLDTQMDRADLPVILNEAKEAVHQGRLMLSEGRRMMKAGTGMVKSGTVLLEGVGDEVKKMELPARSAQAGVMMDKIDRQAGALMTRLIRAGERLEQVSRGLSRLVNRLEQNPSDIIWGEPPKPREIPE
jgi:phospholipid/cholesterol/gamma-HCH transport system substrate-binding protein